ncbi:adenosylmethionine--8-amino-7-oxononanoate transaminase [Candidatus Palibaumannia cicadellinicola]|uniref:Adenosylmethionine-8-amino-7-oxononanoate aminotransferase n=1 Tax=Baumannia cicadellinicola subsp. Homalodisca coagulata TaxID=374463 RepID=Q1LTL9_BAUCH|nr:adenosylmethionine--8-amino-7-oxononanoate transaminase [Candidatus Baumannia cicadellinicola]ABF13979.1 adenosylmethionine-8-amino-7-oxononanoate aminotransferase [Baumannia cicadellinicola str. Hc (Homalodisca coagulata)]MCJ7462322.1 adenosylmethionine--8-amino-7-oxononanoate transaminase [Candidatus Baumannia cicadellinicola]
MHIDYLMFDRYHIWHPYTSMTNPLPSYPVISALGYELILSNGRRLVDGMSSWWAAIHGYNHPVINQAMNDQISRMSHVMFGGITHYPAIELCQRLVALTPSGLDCVFLSDSGSVAVEVAMKMALQYWQARGKPRHKFLALRQGYHGDTFGAMSVSDPDNSMHQLYQDYLPKHLFVNSLQRRFGEIWRDGDELELSRIIAANHAYLTAVILEPIVQGAGGMYFYHPNYLKIARKLCDQYELLLIADEIATGFGRTGEWFACNHAGISPDIICLGKALTGGTMTLSATLTCRNVAETISKGDAGCFMHGPTFMGNPLACAAANASISLLEDESWRTRVDTIATQLRTGLLPLVNNKHVRDVRILGAIGVVETKLPIAISALQSWFVNQGVWIRPFSRYIYLMPPYIIDSEAMQRLLCAISSALNCEKFFVTPDKY